MSTMEAILQQTAKRKHLHGDGLEDDGGEERNYDPVVAAAMEEVHAKKRAKTGVQGRGRTSPLGLFSLAIIFFHHVLLIYLAQQFTLGRRLAASPYL